MLANVFLDFLNRDSRQIYGLFQNLTPEAHILQLTEALNVAVFLCAEYCILPPGFLVECELAKRAVLRRSLFLRERLVRMPLREATIQEFFEKKSLTYSPVSQQYDRVFDRSNYDHLQTFASAVVPRETSIGEQLVQAWEAGPDTDLYWRSLRLTPKTIELFRAIPRILQGRGAAVTWSAIQISVDSLPDDHRRLRHAVQHHYFQLYLEEFKLRVLTGLPMSRTLFGFESTDLAYNYDGLKAALIPLKAWTVVTGMSSESLAKFRAMDGYFQFRDIFDGIAGVAKRPLGIAKTFAQSVQSLKLCRPETLQRELSPYQNTLALPDDGWHLPDAKLEFLDELFRAVALSAKETATNRGELSTAPVSNYPKEHSMSDSMSAPDLQPAPTVVIYVALQEERDVLTRRWKLKSTFEDPVWRGSRNGVSLAVYGSDQMGRVPAAVQTMKFLDQAGVRPNLLLVLGIAAGFEREDVKLGHVIVAQSVADLASRKIREEQQAARPEFRPKEYECDGRVAKFVKSGDFERANWERDVIADAEWPEGVRPRIHYGTIASIDEVVSSHDWITKLCGAWPKLLGVEMEAGGVCAAADTKGMRVCVIRGVSDQGDPLKSDDEWRRRAMKTVAHLVETILDSKVILALLHSKE